jgi:hypothetical protein
MFEYSGAIHMHSIYSDGTGTIEEIAECANEANLDYIILTDHNNIKAKEEGYERWFDKTLVIVGCEINDLENKNHYLAFGINELVGTYSRLSGKERGCDLSAKEFVKEIKDKGGVGFIAHPYEKRKHIPGHPAFPWLAWDCEDFDGIEIWNHMSEWTEGLTEKNRLQRFLHPLKSIEAPDEQAVKMWDELNCQRKVVALGSVDAHAHKQNVLGFYEVVIFPYKILFKSVRTHVFVDKEIKPRDKGNFQFDKNQIIEALKKGCSFIVNSYHGDGKGFRFYAEYDGKIYNMGNDICYDKNKNKKITLKTFLPHEARIRLIKNGRCVDELDGLNCLWDSDEVGNYRIECWIGKKAWIFSNHIRVSEKKN